MINNPYGSVALITGASSGIGQSIAQLLVENGLTVYGTTRKVDPVDIQSVRMLTMDVTNEASILSAVNRIKAETEGIDILVNCAGIGIAGAVEDTSLAEAHLQFEANYFGALNVLRAVLPDMRTRKRGLVINISSVAALVSIPFQSMYSASKAALEATTEALRMELRPYGIKAVLILPGDTKTGFTDARLFAKAMEASTYREATKHAVGVMEKDERNGKPPITVAKEVLRIIKKKNPPVRVTVGWGYKFLVFIRRLLPSRAILALITMIYCKKD